MTPPYQNNPLLSCPLTVPQSDTLPAVDLHGHISAMELARLGLAGLPSSRRRIDSVASKQRWRFIDRIGRGGGRLYAIADLPEAARRDLLARRLEWLTEDQRSRGRPSGSYFDANPDVADAIVAMLAERRQSATLVHKKLMAHFPELQLPSLRSVQRFVATVEQQRKAELASFRDPDQYKGRYRLALGRSDGSVTFANQVWELDTTIADVMTIGGRKSILGLIDRYSRRANFMVAESESAQSVRRFLIETIRKWGVMPACVMTDNGSGYINASVVSALEALGIEHRICPPGSPEKKPHIERLFGSFTRERATELPGFAGHNVADATRIRAKARKDNGRAVIEAHITPDQLQTVLTNWLEGIYHLREHGTTRQAPLARWHGCRHPQTAAPSEAVLRLALTALVGQRRVGKRGIVWQQGRYWSHSLVSWIGQDVIVRRDEDDLGELLIFAPDGSFIDVATDATRTGISQEEVARAARAEQDRYLKAARAEIRAKQKRFPPAAMSASLLRSDAEAAGKIAYLPKPTTPASTPAIDSLIAAIDGRPAGGVQAPPADSAETADIIRLPRAPAKTTSPEDRVRAAMAIIAAADAGGDADPVQLAKARSYATTSEYRAWCALIGDAPNPSSGHAA